MNQPTTVDPLEVCWDLKTLLKTHFLWHLTVFISLEIFFSCCYSLLFLFKSVFNNNVLSYWFFLSFSFKFFCKAMSALVILNAFYKKVDFILFMAHIDTWSVISCHAYLWVTLFYRQMNIKASEGFSQSWNYFCQPWSHCHHKNVLQLLTDRSEIKFKRTKISFTSEKVCLMKRHSQMSYIKWSLSLFQAISGASVSKFCIVRCFSRLGLSHISTKSPGICLVIHDVKVLSSELIISWFLAVSFIWAQLFLLSLLQCKMVMWGWMY